MIEMRNGDVFSIESGIIVHGCNCQGVMGSGVALEVRNRYPEAYAVYKEQEKATGLILGNISYAKLHDADNKYLVNALTQHLYGHQNANYANGRLTSYDAVAECFDKVKTLAETLNINTIAFPLIGAVRGGGNWKIIESIIDETIPTSFTKILYIFQP